tara:strand:- start:2608 stop:2754 length:147 start_codon:yes stop_codon:yes gene_type:complete
MTEFRYVSNYPAFGWKRVEKMHFSEPPPEPKNVIFIIYAIYDHGEFMK